jgi:glutamate/aspartate transport system substrate-binding protein
MKRTTWMLSLVLLATASLGAHAQELTGTLKKIKDSGVIVLGVRDSSIPFSYLDDKQIYIGYSIDLCNKIATAVQRELGMVELKRVYQPVTSATRIPLMANGTIDLECGSTTNNLERQRQVAFTPTSFVTANRILYKKNSGIKVLADLKGKTVVSTAGTSNIKQLTILNADRNLGMTILSAKDHAEAFLMVETDRASAFVMDDVLLASLAATSKNPGAYEISKEALSVEPYGLMERRDDPQFKKVADQAIINLMQSGEIVQIYNKWFLSPIPPTGVNLNVPMSEQLKAVIAKPTDSGDPAAYAVVPQAQQDAMKRTKK